jgi:hypothetical protein
MIHTPLAPITCPKHVYKCKGEKKCGEDQIGEKKNCSNILVIIALTTTWACMLRDLKPLDLTPQTKYPRNIDY